MSRPPASLVLHGATAIDVAGVRADTWIACAGDAISATGRGAGWHELTLDADADVVDVAGLVVTPGFIELHCHGGGGFGFDDGADAIAAGVATHRRHGTTRTLVSLVTNRIGELVTHLGGIAELVAREPSVLGAHLEGPFLAASRRGAHAEAHLRAPTPDAIDRLVSAGRGTLRQLTLAPELPGALDAVERLTAAGVVVAVGHTDADDGQTRAAFDRGARLLTHTFNAMPSLHHRAPGPVGAALDDERVTLEVIADLRHVHPSMVRLLYRQASGRVALVTDAMAAACCGDGRYRIGEVEVAVAGGRATVAGTERLAGSTITQDVALRNAIEVVGIAPEEAVASVTATPARVLGLDDRLGALREGCAADLVVLDRHWAVTAVWTAGHRTS